MKQQTEAEKLIEGVNIKAQNIAKSRTKILYHNPYSSYISKFKSVTKI